ncbi:MAG TPA: hypothetical protein VFE05_05990 [Longimicrobiaceae bacterium]|jgi:hypothetical protein|nr:hypothetical protein [Longimicrobiaceae bacterium]
MRRTRLALAALLVVSAAACGRADQITAPSHPNVPAAHDGGGLAGSGSYMAPARQP